jgi:hypothetical protein
MNGYVEPESDQIFVLSCDGDPTVRDGDWLRLWNSLGVGAAHDVWVGVVGVVYENSGPGGFVQRNTLDRVLDGRRIVHIVRRTDPAQLASKVEFAESRIDTLWSVFYNCQDFASEVATGQSQSFQRDGIVALAFVTIGCAWLTNWLQPRRVPRRRARQRRD